MNRLPILLFLLLPLSGLAAQGGTGEDPRQKTWPSPTAQDWKRPCLITWQRTWKDALAVSRQTRKPILICVNMDGEIASEHYAGIRYRQPEIAALYKPYVCVIASVYRHNPRDYDDQGRRIPCPRFGTCTCGEHIAMETTLYKQFFDGKRIAPRHIMVELDGKEQYDVYYAFDTKSVFDTVRKGIATRKIKPLDIVRGDRSLVERVASRDVEDRMAVEKAFLQGDKKMRRSLLEAAMANQEAAPLGLLRLAVFGVDLEMNRIARTALTKSQSEGAIDLIAEALRAPMPDKDRDALIAALERFGANSWRARSEAVVHRGLASRSGTVRVEEWSKAFAGGQYKAPPKSDWAKVVERLEEKTKLVTREPAQGKHYLELAEEALKYAIAPETRKCFLTDRKSASKYSRLAFLDVLLPAQKAEKLGLQDWRLHRAIALASYYLGDRRTAYARAEKAVKGMPAGDPGWEAMAVLALFAASRQEAITERMRARKPWPPEWLTDVHATYKVLASHPLCQEEQVVNHYDFLYSLRAFGRARQALREGLDRFPQSWDLHKRLRNSILLRRGAAGLEPAYRKLVERDNPAPNINWFAGYAALVAAECHKRASRPDQSRSAYQQALAYYDANIRNHPDSRESSDHYAALALAGLARLALEAKDYQLSARSILACFKRHPQAAPHVDGLGFTPVLTAKALLARLNELRMRSVAASIEGALKALEKLDPRLLDPPAYETGGQPSTSAPRAGNRRGQGRRQGQRQGRRPGARPEGGQEGPRPPRRQN